MGLYAVCEVSVPFVISNKNYGILWDSYSYCRWGNPEDYLQLNRAFKLYDKDGKEGQLTGTYVDKNGQKIVRGEDSIYFEYAMPETSEVCNQTDKGGIQNLPKGFALNGSKGVYEGYVEAPTNSFYQFILYYAGYMKVYIDGKLVVPERWRTAWNPNSYKFETPIRKGVKTPIRIEWQPDGDVSYCGLRVAAPRSEAEKNQLSIWSEMSPDMDYYFIAGQNLDEVISGYRTLTGKASLYPKWTLGFWQSRERYQSSKDIEDNMKKFRDLHIPVDNIVQDWNYWKLDSWGSHEFEAARYPNPQAMLDSVHAMNGRFMISVWPKFYDTVKNYKELDSKGWMYHQAIKDDIHDWLGFRGSFYDAYSDGARKMFWRQMDENLYTKYKFGIDAWWMDASEPNVRDCTPMWYRKALSGPTALGTSTEYFNAYSIVNADAIYNGQRSVNPNQRVFLLTRSGFAGEQRYSTATWSGDIATRWEDMRAQMTAGLNYSMAGLPFWGMDQGGFCVENRYVAAQQEFDKTGKENADLKEWRELQARWNQFGCFVPLYRTHGQWPTREVWNIAPADHPAYKTIVAYDKLRYRLMPYLYSMAGMVHFKDYTMMRGLVMDFNGDDNVYDIKDQWMFGPILSRCQIYDFERMTVANTINHLKMVAEKEGIQYEEQALAVIAEKADGGMRDALSIFDQAASFCMGNITYQKVIEDLNVLDSDNYFRLVDLALENKVAEMMVTLDGILSRGFDGGNMIQGLAQHVRNVMMAKDPQTLPLLETSDDQKAKFQAQAQKAPTPFLYKALELMNQCDIHYRASSNKRLLVELTLIQIGQITQPEDQDVPSAGRTPNRLKSLFQKLLAQSKLASQGAGSEPSGSSENRSSQPGASAATATAVPSSGAPTAASAASNAASYSASATAATSASPEGSAAAGAAIDAASPHKPRLKNIKLGGIGMTFSNLKKREENQRRLHSPYDDTNEEKATITGDQNELDRKSTRLNSSHPSRSRMPSSA